MTVAVIKQNIEDVKLSKWQRKTTEQVAEQVAIALIKIEKLKEEILNGEL